MKRTMGFMTISITRTRTSNYNLYILEQPSSWSASQIRPSWPPSRLRLSLQLALLLNVFIVCPGPPSIVLFVPMDRVSHLTPSLLSERLLTNVQVNNTSALHDTHLYITLALLFFSPFTLPPLHHSRLTL
jgi:hypothetical protein